jgi:hypothetical protein
VGDHGGAVLAVRLGGNHACDPWGRKAFCALIQVKKRKGATMGSRDWSIVRASACRVRSLICIKGQRVGGATPFRGCGIG